MKVVDFHYPIMELSATDYDLLVAIHSARKQYEAYKVYKAERDAPQ